MVEESPRTQISPVFLVRLLIAVVQAAALYWLTDAAVAPRSWPATEPSVFVPLLLTVTYVPLLALLGLKQIPARPLAIWLACATLAVAGLGFHDGARGRIAPYANAEIFWPWLALWPALSVGLFIAQVLVIDAIAERRLVPSYTRHFDTAWKHGVQIALTVVFIGVFWGVLYLGAGLFKLVDIDYFQHLIAHRWFAYPATTLALAVAIHATDVQPSLIRGARSLALTLLSWLLPLLVAILCGFLVSLPFISLTSLWKTHFATSLLLTAAGLLVFLINCSYQDGGTERTGSRIKRFAATIGSITLVPLVALAVWGLGLRVGQYGWTVDRILAAAIVIVAACYAVGYSSATLWSPSWLKRIEITNFATAYVILALIVLLFSPLADPARLMVADQVARLKSGSIPLESFDFTALKFDGARWSTAALTEIAHHPNAAIAAKAKNALALKNRYEFSRPSTSEELADRVTVYPAGRTLPSSFYDMTTGPIAGLGNLLCFRTGTEKCTARFVSLRPGAAEAILFLDTYIGYVFEQNSGGEWARTALITGAISCAPTRQALKSDDFKLETHALPDIVLGDQHLILSPPSNPC